MYKYGSQSMVHERETLAATRLEWAGIIGSELSWYVCPVSVSSSLATDVCVSFGVEKDSLLPLTKYDERKVSAHFTNTKDCEL